MKSTYLQYTARGDVRAATIHVLTIIAESPRAYAHDEEPPRPEISDEEDAHVGVIHERQNYQD